MFTYHDDDFDYFGKEISNYKPFTKEEEKEIFNRYKDGENVVNEIIEHNLKLVVSVSKQYIPYVKCTSLSFSDIIEYGSFGLVKAIEKFDLSYDKLKFAAHTSPLKLTFTVIWFPWLTLPPEIVELTPYILFNDIIPVKINKNNNDIKITFIFFIFPPLLFYIKFSSYMSF